MAAIKTAYPNFEVTEHALRFWHDFLKDVPNDRAEKNLRKHITESRFPPTISDIVKPEPQEYWIPDLPSLEERRAEEAKQLEWKEKAVDMPDWIREKWCKK